MNRKSGGLMQELDKQEVGSLRTLSRQSLEPLYEQLAARIGAQIDSGELSAGTKLESEAELIARYGVSRITVRQAIAVLRKQGRLMARRGKGTFVAERVVSQRLDTLQGFYDALRSQGLEPQLQLLEFSPDAGLQDLARPSEADLPVRLKRLYSLDGQPFALVVGYLPIRAGEMSAEHARQMTVYQILSEHLGIRVAHADVTIRCQRPPADVAKLFGLKRSESMLVMDRQSFAHDRSVCEAMRIYIVAERYQFSLHVAGALDIARSVKPVASDDRPLLRRAASSVE